MWTWPTYFPWFKMEEKNQKKASWGSVFVVSNHGIRSIRVYNYFLSLTFSYFPLFFHPYMPDLTFNNFRASESAHQGFVYTRNSPIDRFWGAEIVKYVRSGIKFSPIFFRMSSQHGEGSLQKFAQISGRKYLLPIYIFQASSYPTKHFTIFEPQNPEIGELI